MAVDISINISPKYQYEQLYTNKARYKDLWGGRGRGGSHEATLYALYRLTSPSYCRIAFVRKIYNDVRHSLWRDFKDRISECELPDDDFSMSDHEMRPTYKHTGNIITSFGVKAEGGRTAKLKSLAGYNLIIIEETDELTEDEFNALDDSVRTIKGDEPEIIRIYNPPGRLHWLWKSYNLIEAEVPGYWRATPKAEVNILSIFSTFHDNILNLAATTVEKWKRYLETNAEYYWPSSWG
jgi:phage terminase large subunit